MAITSSLILSARYRSSEIKLYSLSRRDILWVKHQIINGPTFRRNFYTIPSRFNTSIMRYCGALILSHFPFYPPFVPTEHGIQGIKVYGFFFNLAVTVADCETVACTPPWLTF